MDEVLESATTVQPETPHKSTSFYIQRIIGAILLVALAAVFFYSAYTKLGVLFHWQTGSGFPIKLIADDNSFDSFQWTFLDLGISSIIAASFIAHFMIGFELLLGFLLLFHVYLKSFTYKVVIAVLSVFIIYLLVVILRQGNTGNCGCFGNQHAMTPLQAIWKNLAMIAATLVLWKIYPVKPYKLSPFVFIISTAIALSVPFALRLVYVGTEPEKYTKAVNLDPLYKYSPAPNIDLRKGKHIVAFMSLTCPHCKKAAYLLQIIHHDHPDIPIYMVLDGPDAYYKKFFTETHADSVPFIYYKHTDDFMKMAGPSVPSIFWMNNGVAEYKSVYAYYQLDPGYMEQWLKK